MKTKIAFTILVITALVATNATVSVAGGGGAGGEGGTVWFHCYDVVQGPTPPQTLEVNDQFSVPSVERVGRAKMVCSFSVKSLDVKRTSTDQPSFNAIDLNVFDHLTCYEAQGPNANAVVSYTDNFFGDAQTVKVKGPVRYICSLAIKDCVSGCPEDP